MSYTVSHTEKLQPSARRKELETLLYLFSVSEEKDEVEYYVVDVFNDLTGADSGYSRAFDFQSKAQSDENPALIAENLETLFLNFLSDFPFVSFTLFYGGAGAKWLIDPKMEKYGFSNFTNEAKSTILQKLRSINEKTKTHESTDVDLTKINGFLNKVTFVSPKQTSKGYLVDYLSGLTKKILSSDVCARICKAIENAQQALKSTSLEGKTLLHLNEVSKYGHSLSKSQIKDKILNTIFSENIFRSHSIPLEFQRYNADYPEGQMKEHFEDCQDGIFKAYSVKGMDKQFWLFFKSICEIYETNKNTTLNEISDLIANGKLQVHPLMNHDSSLLFASYIKGEFYED